MNIAFFPSLICMCCSVCGGNPLNMAQDDDEVKIYCYTRSNTHTKKKENRNKTEPVRVEEKRREVVTKHILTCHC